MLDRYRLGLSFQPVVVRVVDSASPQHPVLAAPVGFLTTVMHSGGSVHGVDVGDTNPGNPAMPVILKVTATYAMTDGNGLASVVPSSGGFSAPVEVDVAVSAGTTAFLDNPLFLWPMPPGSSQSQQSYVPVQSHPVGVSGR